jgi:hypothetical protein
MSELTADYSSLELAERVNALQAARAAGREAARADAGAAGGVDVEHATRREYLLYVVEPAWDSDLCSDEELRFWRDNPDAEIDPRVAAFAAGWAEEVREILEDLAEDREICEDG